MAKEPIIQIENSSFILDNTSFDTADIVLTFAQDYEDLVITIYDETYDKSIVFSTLISTEENILNVGYDLQDYERFNTQDIEFGSNFDSWEFGKDSFGNALTIVKTEKLSGKGHNIKTKFVDFSKSKWTLETMGTTYRMRKARR